MRAAKFRALARVSALSLVGVLSVTAVPAATAADADRRATRTNYGSNVQVNPGETYKQAFDRVSGQFGGSMETVRVFYPGLPAGWSTINANVRNRPVVVSFKAPPSEVLAGKHDRYLRQWFKSAPTDRRTYWTYFHEPEDDVEAGAFTAARYRAAWSHLKQLERAAENRRLRSTLILMCWTVEPASGRSWKDWFAGRRVIDVLGWDCYNGGRVKGYYAEPRSILKPAVAASRSVGKPWGIAEFGTTVIEEDGGRRGRARWLREFARVVQNKGGRFATYFDCNVGGVDFRLHDRISRRAWGRVIQEY